MARSLTCLVSLCLATAVVAATAEGQQTNDQQNSRSTNTHTLQIPPGNPVLELQAQLPDELRAGESYDYQIRVRNVTENMAVHDVVVVQKTPAGVEIESSKTEQSKTRGDSQAQQSADKKKKSKQNQASKKEQDQEGFFGNWQSSEDQQKAKEQQGYWMISKLKPGESKTFHVTAVSDEVGKFDTCLAVKSFIPVLCLATNYVKPDVQIVKKAPSQASLCEEINYEYFVKNTGSGDAGDLTVRDPLPNGIETIDGKKELEFKVDGLEKGDTRKFVAKLQATKTGDIGSRATVKLKNGTQAQSNKPVTKIRQADLAVTIDGPDTEYIGRPLSYTVRVENKGNAAARDARLMLQIPNDADLVRAGALRRESQAQRDDSPAQGQPTVATRDDQPTLFTSTLAQDNEAASQSRQSKKQTADRSWDLGTLKPGESRSVNVVLRSREPGQVEATAVALFACDQDRDQESMQAEAKHQTELIALASLLLSVVDDNDPVKNGNDVSYSIVVANQGDAPDHDIKIAVELPNSLKYVDAEGPTKAENNGNKVSFAPIKELRPGQRVEYTLTAKATGTGDILLKTTLDSKAQSKTATAEEPTQLFKD